MAAKSTDWSEHAIRRKLNEILTILTRLEKQTSQIESKVNRVIGMALGDARRDEMASKSLEKLEKEVAEQTDATQAAVTMIEGLAQQIRDAGGDEDKLNELADKLEASQQQLAAAITANTPHDPSGN